MNYERKFDFLHALNTVYPSENRSSKPFWKKQQSTTGWEICAVCHFLSAVHFPVHHVSTRQLLAEKPNSQLLSSHRFVFVHELFSYIIATSQSSRASKFTLCQNYTNITHASSWNRFTRETNSYKSSQNTFSHKHDRHVLTHDELRLMPELHVKPRESQALKH